MRQVCWTVMRFMLVRSLPTSLTQLLGLPLTQRSKYRNDTNQECVESRKGSRNYSKSADEREVSLTDVSMVYLLASFAGVHVVRLHRLLTDTTVQRAAPSTDARPCPRMLLDTVPRCVCVPSSGSSPRWSSLSMRTL